VSTTVQRYMKCCGGPVVDDRGEHTPNCPSIVRAGLSWIEDTAHGEKIRKRALVAFDAIVAERDQLRAAAPPPESEEGGER